MDSSLGFLFNLYTLSTGRRLFALAQVMKTAAEHDFEELVAHCKMSLAHDHETRSLENRWAAPSAPPAGSGRVQQIDIQVDRVLVAIRDSAQAQADGAGAGEGDIAGKVTALLGAIFPRGVQAVTQLTFIEELSAVDGIVASLESKQLAPIVKELGLTRLAKRLGALAAEYRAALEAPEPAAMSFGEVRAARARGQEHVLQAVALIVGRHHGASTEDAAARTALLAPILKQNEAVRLYLRARRAVQDVHPETGEVDPAAPVGDALGLAEGAKPAPVTPA